MNDNPQSSTDQVENCCETRLNGSDELVTVQIRVRKSSAVLSANSTEISDPPINLILVELGICLKKFFGSVQINFSQVDETRLALSNSPQNSKIGQSIPTDLTVTPSSVSELGASSFDDIGLEVTKFLKNLAATDQQCSIVEEVQAAPRFGSLHRSPYKVSFAARVRPEFSGWLADIQNKTYRSKASLIDEAIFRFWRFYGFPEQP